jgi:hypothetical protein
MKTQERRVIPKPRVMHVGAAITTVMRMFEKKMPLTDDNFERELAANPDIVVTQETIGGKPYSIIELKGRRQ